MTRISRSDRSRSARSVHQRCRSDGYLPVSTRLVLEIAERTNTDVEALPALYDAIDPEALDRLVDHPSDRPVSVTFEYYGHRITVTGDAEIDISPR